jgi:hypothetical protein
MPDNKKLIAFTLHPEVGRWTWWDRSRSSRI